MSKEHEALLALPSIGAITIWLWQVPVEKWAAFAGLVFVVLQIAHRSWRWYYEWKGVRKGKPPPITGRGDL